MQVPLEPSPLLVAGAHDAGPRGRQLLARLRVRERDRGQLREVPHPLLGVRREGLRLVEPERDGAPEPAGDGDGRRDRRGDAFPPHALPDALGGPGGVDAGERARLADLRDRAAPELQPFSDRVARRAVPGPGGEDRDLLPLPLEPHHARPVGPEEPPELLGHDGEDLLRLLLARDRDRDAPQRRLLLRQRPDLDLPPPGVRDVADDGDDLALAARHHPGLVRVRLAVEVEVVLVRLDAALVERPLRRGQRALRHVRGQPVVDGAADHVRRQQLGLRVRVVVDVRAVAPEPEHEIRERVEQRPVPRLLAPALADVDRAEEMPAAAVRGQRGHGPRDRDATAVARDPRVLVPGAGPGRERGAERLAVLRRDHELGQVSADRGGIVVARRVGEGAVDAALADRAVVLQEGEDARGGTGDEAEEVALAPDLLLVPPLLGDVEAAEQDAVAAVLVLDGRAPPRHRPPVAGRRVEAARPAALLARSGDREHGLAELLGLLLDPEELPEAPPPCLLAVEHPDRPLEGRVEPDDEPLRVDDAEVRRRDVHDALREVALALELADPVGELGVEAAELVLLLLAVGDVAHDRQHLVRAAPDDA